MTCKKPYYDKKYGKCPVPQKVCLRCRFRNECIHGISAVRKKYGR